MNKKEQWWKDHQEQFKEDLITLLRIPSISIEDPKHPEAPYGKACVEALKAIENIAHRFGFSTYNDKNQYVVLNWGNNFEDAIGIFSHLDVVPEGDAWKYSPFEPTFEDNRIIARGVGDNKGPALSTLYALAYLKDMGFKPKHSIRHFFGANEECGMNDIQYFVEKNPMPKFSLIADTAFPVCHGEKGVLEIECEREISNESAIKTWKSGVMSNAVPSTAETVILCKYEDLQEKSKNYPEITITKIDGDTSKVTATGIAAHAAFPEGSSSAQNNLCKFLSESKALNKSDLLLCDSILALFNDYYGKGLGIPYEDEISGNLTAVGGFSRYDKKESNKFCQNINIRYNISANYDSLIKDLTQTLAKYDFKISKISNSAPMYVDKDQPIISALVDIANKHLNRNEKPYVMGGGTYARKLKNAIGFGPGIRGAGDFYGKKRGHAHQVDEYINQETLVNAFMVYTEALIVVDNSVS